MGVRNSSSDDYTFAQNIRLKAASNQLERLENNDCINAYAIDFQTRQGDLILVTNDTSPPSPYYYDNLNPRNIVINGSGTIVNDTDGNKESVLNPYGWVCGQSEFYNNTEPLCSALLGRINRTNWAPFGKPVSYCLADTIEQRCELQLSLELIVVVIVFNLAKALILGSIFLFVKENPLMTIGDAISSFLQKEDETTKSLCLMGEEYVNNWDTSEFAEDRKPMPYEITKRTWGIAVTESRWQSCIVLYVFFFFS